MRQMLANVMEKMPTERRKEVVYEVPCKDCEQKYIGETKRKMKVRIAEHKYALSRGGEKNGIAVHGLQSDQAHFCIHTTMHTTTTVQVAICAYLFSFVHISKCAI